MKPKLDQNWKFINNQGDFELKDPHQVSHLYFPLINKAGMISVVTPKLHGDIKTGQHTFLSQPLSVQDLNNTCSTRNFWVHIFERGSWSATGSSAMQSMQTLDDLEGDEVFLRAGFLWHQVIRRNKWIGLESVTTNYCPANDDQVEVMNVSLANISGKEISLTPTAAIPIFGRSADNLRDHRHVSSLLNRIKCNKYGVLVCPTLSFDERGHQPNKVTYAVIGIGAGDSAPEGFFPTIDGFIGEGGSLDWPEAIVHNRKDFVKNGHVLEGFEALGGLRFSDVSLQPGQSCSFFIISGVLQEGKTSEAWIEKYGSQRKFDHWLNETKNFWEEQIERLSFNTGDERFDLWLKWVGLQPILRRQIGNSFLPYHDYGKGGRGWRDLWQDILITLVSENGEVDQLLYENFAGVRLDGSNATIIGTHPGEFKADRNNIPRVWMDHGAWPLLTTRLYIDQTGDLLFLLRDQVYFKDHLIQRAQGVDSRWDVSQGVKYIDAKGKIFSGSILEHLLIQHLTAFFNVGEHNQIKLEGADWNDGMDMAPDRGESVAFTALYASNFLELSRLVLDLNQYGISHVALLEEILPLLDTLNEKINYDNINQKQQVLKDYFSSVDHTVSGIKQEINLVDLSRDLEAKAKFLTSHIRNQEWVTDELGYGWFNGYYDNDGQRLEGDFPSGVRMTLTGQVFTLMADVATEDQARMILKSAKKYLYKADVGGYRLNTNFNQVLMNMGRCFGFSYGDKENGAVFCHMAVMYAYALYERGFIQEGYSVLNHLFQQSQNFEVSRIYPGIPEYFNANGRGLYPYLTGSASWYLLTLLTQAFGVRGHLGDLILLPKLIPDQFNSSGEVTINCQFAKRKLKITYKHPALIDFGNYKITEAWINDQSIIKYLVQGVLIIKRDILTALDEDQVHQITVHLG